MSAPHGKILVVRGGAIGDFILTLPVLRALRGQFPEARLELLGYARTADLALAAGLVDAVRSIDARPLAGFFARNGTLAAELQDYFAGFAIVMSYLYDPDGIFQANVARCSRAQFIAGPHRPDERTEVHATDVFLKPLERLAIFAADPAPTLDVGQASHLPCPDERHELALPWLAVHPGSGSEEKNWPEVQWAGLFRVLINETNCQLLLIGGEAEGEKIERLASRLPVGRRQIAWNLPLVQLAHRLARCGAFVGHDSGITHLAAALGVSGAVLWGPTSEAIWRPRSAGMKILRGPGGLAQLDVAKVAAELRALLARAAAPP